MCGVVGIAGSSDVNLELYDALTILQHRGQDAAGMVTDSNGELHQCKGEGLVRDVFRRGGRQNTRCGPGGTRAEGLLTQSVPGHKVEVIGFGR